MSILIRRLQPDDAERLCHLRRQALLDEPFAFLASPEDDRASAHDSVRELLDSSSNGSSVFGAFDGDELVGMVGLTRDRPVKAAHRACVWGVYVDSRRRKRGVGAWLLAAILDHARQMDGVTCVYLSVSEKTPGARRLYESAGFTVWGLEPDAMRYREESAREYHLAMEL